MVQNISHAVMAQRHEAKDSLDDFPTPPWATRALLEHVLEKDKIENKFLTPQQRGQALAEIITDLEIYSIKGILN